MTHACSHTPCAPGHGWKTELPVIRWCQSPEACRTLRNRLVVLSWQPLPLGREYCQESIYYPDASMCKGDQAAPHSPHQEQLGVCPGAQRQETGLRRGVSCGHQCWTQFQNSFCPSLSQSPADPGGPMQQSQFYPSFSLGFKPRESSKRTRPAARQVEVGSACFSSQSTTGNFQTAL